MAPATKPHRLKRRRSLPSGKAPLRRARVRLAALFITAGILALALSGIMGGDAGGQEPAFSNSVRVLKISGIIDPLMADFTVRGIEQAEAEGARAVLLVLDTPGGLDTPMRDIIKKITGSPVPVVAYVAPSGARAASAGTFIVMAADAAVMAPGTNLGAAHPVVFGLDPDSTEGVKITNDSAAYIRSLAEANGRNANWAELAVRQSVSLSADEALEQQVIDLKAEDKEALVQQLDGFVCKAKGITIDTGGAVITESEMTLRQQLLHLVLNPNVAYFLFLYGLLALSYEFVHPGIGLGGITGVIAMVLSFYAMRILPVSYTGVLLILAGVALLAVDLYVSSHGALSIGGIAAIVIGSFFLFEAPFLRVSLPLNLALAAVAGGFFLIAARKVMRARRLPVQTGQTAMIGVVGYARSDLNPLGQVFVHGEIWSAEAPEGEIIEKGEEIVVTDVKGLMLKVKRTV